MARIRTIKPEFWANGKASRCCRDARLLFLGLLNESDDEGRQIGSPKRIGGIVFPHDDDVSSAEIVAWLGELEREGLITQYRVGGVDYLLICGFTTQQKVSHPADSRLPSPDDAEPPQTTIHMHSGDIPEPLAKSSGDIPETLRPDLGIDLGIDLGPRKPTLVASDGVDRIFDAWKVACGKNGNTVLSPERRRLIEKARKLYPDEDLIDAVRGWKKSPHHRGENDSRTVYNDIDLLLRGSKHIEQFRDLERGVGPVGRAPDAAVDLVQRMRTMEGR